MKTTLWVPAVDRPPWPCVDSWMNVDWPRGEGCGHNFVRSGANNPRYSWNAVVRDFLKTDYDYLWSCHNDIALHPGTLKRLLSWDKPLVSALIFMRGGTVLPQVWKGTVEGQEGYKFSVPEMVQWFRDHPEAISWQPVIIEPRPEDALFAVDFTVTGCLLIHRSVLEAMQDPWFLWDDDYKGGGEDRRFFENAKAAGFEGYVDRSCVVSHLGGDAPVSSMAFMAWSATIMPEAFVDPDALKAARLALAAIKQEADHGANA